MPAIHPRDDSSSLHAGELARLGMTVTLSLHQWETYGRFRFALMPLSLSEVMFSSGDT